MNTTQPAESPLAKLQSIRLPLWLVLVLTVLLLALFISRQMALSEAEARFASERAALTAQMASEQAALLARANAAIAQNSDAAHVLFGTSLAWAIRGDLLQGNTGEIDLFFGELVRNARIQQVALADRDGRVMLASDRKLQGALFSEHFPAELATGQEVAVHAGNGGNKYLLMPIQGLNTRLGTAVIVYTPEPELAANAN